MSAPDPYIHERAPEPPPTPDPTEWAPQPGRGSFVCPHCGAFSAQWKLGQLLGSLSAQPGINRLHEWAATRCQVCIEPALFYKEALVYPTGLVGAPAPGDMPETVKPFYEEARSVAAISPRSAAALLRIALEQLVNVLEPGEARLNDKIGALHGRGLDPRVTQAMDVIRGFGNAAGAHVGEISLEDDQTTVEMLFDIVLIVVDQVITQPKNIAHLYGRLSPGVQAAIEQRNAKAIEKRQ